MTSLDYNHSRKKEKKTFTYAEPHIEVCNQICQMEHNSAQTNTGKTFI